MLSEEEQKVVLSLSDPGGQKYQVTQPEPNFSTSYQLTQLLLKVHLSRYQR